MINRTAEAIRSHGTFIVATHINPDGDALGSAIALGLALKTMGKKVMVYDRDGVPDTYDFLPESSIISTQIGDFRAEVLILLDCNNLSRAGLDSPPNSGPGIVIDHHETDGDYGDIKWVEPDTPATGMMVLRLIHALGVKLSEDMAQNLYTAITLDTGTFRYGNTTAEALSAGAELTEAGARPDFVADRLYNNWSMNRFALFHKAMEAMELEGRISFMRVSMQMLSETSTSQADTENFVNFPLVMDEILASVLLKEMQQGLWKASIRSKDKINVAIIASRFGGGGHKNAAGCTIEGDYATIKETLLKALKEAGAA